MRRCVWLVAQLLDGKSSHRDIRTLFPTSHHLDSEKSVHSPRDNREGRNTRARVRISGHARRGDRRKFPRVACRPTHARARVFRPTSLARAKSASTFSVQEEQGEDIVIRSRITCSLNDLTWHRYDRKHIEEHLQVCNCCSSETFFFLFARQCFVYWSNKRLPERGTSSEHSHLVKLTMLNVKACLHCAICSAE